MEFSGTPPINAEQAAGKEGSARSPRMSRPLQAMLAALVVGFLLMAVKFFAFWITGSTAILSDALESIINVVAATMASGSLILSAKPPDASHPYGHGKIEYFSAGFEGALIALAALGILKTGIDQITNPRPLPHLYIGLILLAAAGLVNLVVAVMLIRVGTRARSLVLVADGKHLLTDVYSSVGVLAGLALVALTGRYWLDGAVACVTGAYIVVAGIKLIRQSFLGLMDTADTGLLEEICEVLVKNRKEVWIDVHRLRAWKSGNRVHLDFHLILPGDLPLEEGHREVKDLEQIFSNHFKGLADVLIHLDPCTDAECPVCANDPCDLRLKPAAEKRVWQLETLTTEVTRGAPSKRHATTQPPDKQS